MRILTPWKLANATIPGFSPLENRLLTIYPHPLFAPEQKPGLKYKTFREASGALSWASLAAAHFPHGAQSPSRECAPAIPVKLPAVDTRMASRQFGQVGDSFIRKGVKKKYLSMKPNSPPGFGLVVWQGTWKQCYGFACTFPLPLWGPSGPASLGASVA